MGLTYEVQRVFRKLARPKSMTPGITSRQAHRPGFLLSEPLVTLYVSAAAKTDSIHAFDMLSTVPTGFQVKASPDNSIGVEFAGQCQYGIEGVQRLKESIDQFNKVLLQPGPDLDMARKQMYRVGVREQAIHELEEQRQNARLELDKILDN